MQGLNLNTFLRLQQRNSLGLILLIFPKTIQTKSRIPKEFSKQINDLEVVLQTQSSLS